MNSQAVPFFLKYFDLGGRQVAADDMCHPVSVVVYLKSASVLAHKMSQFLQWP